MTTGIVDDLSDLFADEVTLEPPTAFDMYGKPTGYGAPQTWRAHLQGHHRVVRDVTGREKVSTVQAIIAGAPGANVHWRCTLPSRYQPQRQPLISVDHFTDEGGAHHEQLNF